MKDLKLLIIATFFYSALSCEVSASFDLEIKDNKMLTGTCVTLADTHDEAGKRITSMLYDLSFVLEKVTPKNHELWRKFAEEQTGRALKVSCEYGQQASLLRKRISQHKNGSHDCKEEDVQSVLSDLQREFESVGNKTRKFGQLQNTATIFGDFIDYAKRSEKTECWIAFVTRQKLHAAKIREAIDFEQIQICFTVNTTLEIPITDHMETFRSILLCRNVPVLEFATFKFEVQRFLNFYKKLPEVSSNQEIFWGSYYNLKYSHQNLPL